MDITERVIMSRIFIVFALIAGFTGTAQAKSVYAVIDNTSDNNSSQASRV